MAKLKPLHKQKKRPELSERTNRAYTTIKEAILSLDLEPGKPLFEEELAEQLGISKTPVRGALQELERDGLVIRIPYKGTYVAEVTRQDLHEIIQLKGVLEGFAARLNLEQLSQEALDEAEGFLNKGEQALRDGEIIEALEWGNQFHDVIIGNAPNQRLLNILNVLDDQVYRLRHLGTRTLARMKQSAAEHRKILEAVRKGDPDEVEAAFRHHLNSFLYDLMDSNSSEKLIIEHHERRDDSS